MGWNIAYKRVSTVDQNTERQLEGAGIEFDKVYEDKAGGGDLKRPQFQKMMDNLRPGDTIHVHSMDRLARNLKDLLDCVDRITRAGAGIRFVKENLTFEPESVASPMSKLILGVMGSVAEFERAIIKERQAEGIKAAKKRGIYKGSDRKFTPEMLEEAKRRRDAGEAVAAVAKSMGFSRQTLYLRLAELDGAQAEGNGEAQTEVEPRTPARKPAKATKARRKTNA